MKKSEFFQEAVLKLAGSEPIDTNNLESSMNNIIEKAKALTDVASKHSTFEE